tara:strand:- start:1502 stop:1792 length:291 start_codon:yes stop_codon:yes gene_type:complete
MVIRIATKTKMPGKPDAARGKTTRKGKMKKILKNVIARQGKTKKPGNMSPGAMGGVAGTGLRAAAARLAKRIKPAGRRNANDVKRAKQMMLKRKGK